MIDVLTTHPREKIGVVELKADEDTHLPLQGLDYCSPVAAPCAWRVPALRVFSGAGIGKEPPWLLFLVDASLAPASYDRRLSRYISPQIEWTVVGIDERWRDGVSPSLRASRDDRIMHGFQSQENQPVLILLARLPADGVHPPTVPGDTRCDRLPARLRAGWFDLLPTECGHVNQFSD